VQGAALDRSSTRRSVAASFSEVGFPILIDIPTRLSNFLEVGFPILQFLSGHILSYVVTFGWTFSCN